MKTLGVLLILTLFTSVRPAFAAKMDQDTQQLVVDKLERVLESLDSKSAAWIPTHQRLADVLSERARQRFMMEVEAGCKGCKGSVADRKRATKLYETILASGKAQNPGAVTLQLAHLKGMAGQNAAAKKLYLTLTNAPKGKWRGEWVSDARVALADIYFQESDNKNAKKQYEILINDKNVNPKDRPVVAYRLAWCRFNDGKLTQAIKGLEALIVSDDMRDDPSMRTEALMDLATFYARRPISKREIEQYRAITPEPQRKEMLLNFASEAERIGQKAAADRILELALREEGVTADERLDVFIRRAQIKYSMGNAANATEYFAVAAANLKELGCKDEESCAAVQKRMKKYVTDLHRSQRVQTGVDVLKAYYIYSQTFPADTKMAILGAQVAVELEKYPMAITMYRQASTTAKDEKLKSTAIDGEIRVAELSKDAAAREAAYKNALELRPNDKKNFKIRYQLAYLAYERKQWDQAADEFRTLANDRAGDADLRKKSADLALDVLAIQKRDRDIELWAAEFARAVPAGAAEYRDLSRRAMINQAAAKIDSDDASTSELKDSLAKLKHADLKGVPAKERVLILKNRAALAQKIGDDAEKHAALTALLASNALSEKDREETLARLVGAAEDRFDFKTAYKTALKMKFPKLSAAERERRLGTLADLSGATSSARKHYVSSLKRGLKGWAATSVRVRLVQLSSNPKAELKKQAKFLKSSAAPYGDAVLAVYGRTRDGKAVEPHLRHVPSSVATFIRKQPFLTKQAANAKSLAAHKLSSSGDRAMRRSIESRQKLLAQADKNLTEALKLRDFTSQILALNTVALENNRFAADLVALPAPKSLKGNDLKRYGALIEQSAKPYRNKASLAISKLKEMWNQSKTIERIVADLDSARPEIRPLVQAEVLKLANVSPSTTLKWKLEGAARQGLPSMKELASALEDAKRDPRDVRGLEKLKTLEAKVGHPLMPAYLDRRMEQIQSKEI